MVVDPITITAALLNTSGQLVKLIYNLRNTLKDAPLLLTTIAAECTTVRTSLSGLQILQKRWLARSVGNDEDVLESIDIAISGCAMVLSVLEEDMQSCVKAGHQPNDKNAVRKSKLLLSKDHLREIVSQLRGQQHAISLLITVLQSHAIEDIKDNLARSRPERYNTVKKAQTLYEKSDRASVMGGCPINNDSTVTSTRFDFDTEVLASRAYQRILAYSRRGNARQRELSGRFTKGVVDRRSRFQADELSRIDESFSDDCTVLADEQNAEATPTVAHGKIVKHIKTNISAGHQPSKFYRRLRECFRPARSHQEQSHAPVSDILAEAENLWPNYSITQSIYTMQSYIFVRKFAEMVKLSPVNPLQTKLEESFSVVWLACEDRPNEQRKFRLASVDMTLSIEHICWRDASRLSNIEADSYVLEVHILRGKLYPRSVNDYWHVYRRRKARSVPVLIQGLHQTGYPFSPTNDGWSLEEYRSRQACALTLGGNLYDDSDPTYRELLRSSNYYWEILAQVLAANTFFQA